MKRFNRGRGARLTRVVLCTCRPRRRMMWKGVFEQLARAFYVVLMRAEKVMPGAENRARGAGGQDGGAKIDKSKEVKK